ncbi:cryptochrome/photolyase family protein [Lapillicoccus sp.]|uniref:cryptochrome/photolyase family protein n=1 Tax=Lapillicoccus sp. TaxID=1909287 RepID=UPI0025EF7D63|nr:cryptochrome/photolyase family protein [Lapillicoccus sp.]
MPRRPPPDEGNAAQPTRWLFGDQLGPHFLDDHEGPVLLIESRRVFARRRFHRQKAHLVLSAMRHRAAELGDRATIASAATYREALDTVSGPLEVIQPTSRAAVDLVRRLAEERDIERLPARGFSTTRAEFDTWANSRGTKRLLMEDFYRDARRRHDVLMDGADPAGGSWNYDHENREPPPKGATTLGVAEPRWPQEDEIDAQVRADLDAWEADGDVTFLGVDGPRKFAATRAEALAVLDDFVEHRLPVFGPHEDAVLEGDDWMAHSLLSAPFNLGLLDPAEVVERAEAAYRSGAVPLASAEGFIRQVMGWRDYIWHLYWHLGEDYRHANHLSARRHLPDWFAGLDAEATDARCLSQALVGIRDHGWVHHIPRLMILGNYALQRGWRPDEVTDWFHRAFVDGYDWVMVPNVVGMSQHADGGVLATKPYAAGGAYINRMTDHCGSCRFNPKIRVGDDACPFTAGYWAFLERNREKLAGNHRMAQPLHGLDRLKDLEAVVAQEAKRGSDPP